VTGKVGIGLEQNVIDAAINEWRKSPVKNTQLDKLLAKMMKLWTKCVLFWLSNNIKVVKMQYFVRFISPGSAETDSGWGEKLNSHLMASCIRNIRTKTY